MSTAAFLLAAALQVAPPAKPAPVAPSSQNLPPADLCDTTGHRQFDFWIGRWNVHRAGTGQLIAQSLIEKLYNGCALRENWMPSHGFGGGSLNSYRPKLNQWRQFWTDSGNEVHEYTGIWDGTKMVFTGPSTDGSGEKKLLRMTFEQLNDGSVVQTGFESSDEGKNWKPSYKLIYRKAR